VAAFALAVERLEATDTSQLSPEQALIDLGALLEAQVQLRVVQLGRMHDADVRKLAALDDEPSLRSWVRRRLDDAAARIVRSMPRSRVGRALALTYVLAVAVLAAMAWGHDHEGFDPLEAAALILSLPCLFVAFPAIYLAGGLTFAAVGEGGPLWPVALVFALSLSTCALANVWLCRAIGARLSARGSRRKMRYELPVV
jgi:hypothetical protein